MSTLSLCVDHKGIDLLRLMSSESDVQHLRGIDSTGSLPVPSMSCKTVCFMIAASWLAALLPKWFQNLVELD